MSKIPTTYLSTTIPFGGFYESKWSGEIDHVEEMECEHFEEKQTEEGVADELRIDSKAYWEILYRHSDYSTAYHEIAKQYAAEFNHWASELLGFKLGLRFEIMQSPREYNFTTDRIFCDIPRATVRRLFNLSKRDGHESLRKVIADRFTSYNGFCSYYDNDLESWLEKSWREWDHNEIATLLCATLAKADDFDSDWEWSLFYSMAESDDFYTAHSNCVDWEKVDSDIAEIRADRIAEMQEDNPDYIAPIPRCEFTLDIFEWFAARNATNATH